MEKAYKSCIESQFEIFDKMLEGVSVYKLIFNDKNEVIDGILEYMNPTTVEIMGLSYIDIGKSSIELFSLDFIQPHLNAINEFYLKGQKERFEVYYEPTDKFFLVSGFDLSDNLFAVLRVDITEHKRAEDQIRNLLEDTHEFAEELRSTTKELQRQQNELKASENHFRLLYENSFDAIFLTKPDGSILAANFAAQKMFGRTEEEIIRLGIVGLIISNENLKRALKEREQSGSLNAELIAKRKDGSAFPVDVTSSVFTDPDGSVKTSLIIRDLTERKKAEEELQAILQRFYIILSNMHASVLLVTEYNQIEFANQEFCNYFGLSEQPADLIGLTDSKMIKKIRNAYQNSDEEIERISKIVNHSQPIIGEEVPMSDGRTCLRDFIPLFIEGESYGRLWVHVDITKRKRAEEELKQARDTLELKVQERTVKLEETIEELERSNKELQSFAYITSHDLQEPLRNIASYAQLLKRRYKGKLDPDADEFIDFMVDGSRRMKEMIQGLLDYSRAGTRGDEFKEFQANIALNYALSSLRSAISEVNAEVTSDELPIIFADESQIILVFQNLIGNAIKFRKEGIKPKVHISAKKKDNEYVFSVSDNGIGLEEQYIDKIFEVFKRLHAIGEYQGAGIGLSIVKRIIDRHGGRVWVESEFGVGSAFYFTIPIINK